jgi:hypothetical protein
MDFVPQIAYFKLFHSGFPEMPLGSREHLHLRPEPTGPCQMEAHVHIQSCIGLSIGSIVQCKWQTTVDSPMPVQMVG